MIYQALSTHPDLWSLYRESQAVIATYFPAEMTPGSSMVVGGEDVDDETAAAIRRAFYEAVGNVEVAHGAMGRNVPLIVRSRLSGVLRGSGPAARRPRSAWWRRPRTTASGSRCSCGPSRTPSSSTWCGIPGVRSPRCTGVGRRSPVPAVRTAPGIRHRGLSGDALVLRAHTRMGGHGGGHGHGDLRPAVAPLQRVLRARSPAGSRPSPHRPLRGHGRRTGPGAGPTGPMGAPHPRPLQRYSRKLPVVNTWTMPSADKWRKVGVELSGVLPLVATESRRLGYPAD